MKNKKPYSSEYHSTHIGLGQSGLFKPMDGNGGGQIITCRTCSVTEVDPGIFFEVAPGYFYFVDGTLNYGGEDESGNGYYEFTLTFDGYVDAFIEMIRFYPVGNLNGGSFEGITINGATATTGGVLTVSKEDLIDGAIIGTIGQNEDGTYSSILIDMVLGRDVSDFVFDESFQPLADLCEATLEIVDDTHLSITIVYPNICNIRFEGESFYSYSLYDSETNNVFADDFSKVVFTIKTSDVSDCVSLDDRMDFSLRDFNIYISTISFTAMNNLTVSYTTSDETVGNEEETEVAESFVSYRVGFVKKDGHFYLVLIIWNITETTEFRLTATDETGDFSEEYSIDSDQTVDRRTNGVFVWEISHPELNYLLHLNFASTTART